MRILYPVLWPAPGREASREQTVKTAAALARHGHDVTLLMPQRRRDPAVSAQDLREYYGVEGDFGLVQRPSRWPGDRLLPSLMWLGQVFRDPEIRGADLIYSRVPAMLGAGHLSPVPFATDHYRLWPDDWPTARPLFRRTLSDPLCAALILHSDYAAESYRRIDIAEEIILVAHNGADGPGEFDKAAARDRLDLPLDRTIAVYAGRISAQKGLDQILALATLRPDVLFLLVGSEGEGAIERLASGRDNVRILPWAEPAALPAWLAAADILLIPASRAPLTRYRNCVLPMKLFAYLGAGRPILAPESPDTAELLRHEENALLVPPDLPEAAAAALDRLCHEPGLSERLAANARLLSATLSWDKRAQRISAFLEQRLAAMASRRTAQRPAYGRPVTAASAPGDA